MGKNFEALEDFIAYNSVNNLYMPREYDDIMYHYTSPAGFDGILNGDSQHLVLWASRYDCLNDTSEGTIAKLLYNEVCDNLKREGLMDPDAYEFFSHIQPSTTTIVCWNAGDYHNLTIAPCQRYIACFSRNNDSLAMWNYYTKGNRYEGYNIGMLAPDVADRLCSLFDRFAVKTQIYPVIYDEKEQVDLITAFLRNICMFYDKENGKRLRDIISHQLYDWGLIFKKHHFSHEEEVRIIVDVALHNDRVPSSPFEIKYRSACGYLVPYIELKLDKSVLLFASIGPLLCADEHKETQKKVLKELLTTYGYTHAIPQCSKIQIRY